MRPPLMPRFFFHLYDGQEILDEEGLELSDAAAARLCARKQALVSASLEVLDGHLTLGHRIEVRDESGDSVFSVTFGDLVRIS